MIKARCMRGFYVPFAELRRKAFEDGDLFLAEFDLALSGGLLQPERPLMFGHQVAPLPDAAHAAINRNERDLRRHGTQLIKVIHVDLPLRPQ